MVQQFVSLLYKFCSLLTPIDDDGNPDDDFGIWYAGVVKRFNTLGQGSE